MTETILPYTTSDYEEVRALHQKTIQENDGFAKNLSFHSDFQNIVTVYDAFFVMRVKDNVVGMVALKPDGQIKRLQVARDYQGKGYGRALMEHLLDYAKNKGIKQVHLDVSAPNRKARQLYLDMGFTITHQETVTFGPDKESFDMTFMELML